MEFVVDDNRWLHGEARQRTFVLRGDLRGRPYVGCRVDGDTFSLELDWEMIDELESITEWLKRESGRDIL